MFACFVRVSTWRTVTSQSRHGKLGLLSSLSLRILGSHQLPLPLLSSHSAKVPCPSGPHLDQWLTTHNCTPSLQARFRKHSIVSFSWSCWMITHIDVSAVLNVAKDYSSQLSLKKKTERVSQLTIGHLDVKTVCILFFQGLWKSPRSPAGCSNTRNMICLH